jgi:hypothetical protein
MRARLYEHGFHVHLAGALRGPIGTDRGDELGRVWLSAAFDNGHRLDPPVGRPAEAFWPAYAADVESWFGSQA